MTSILFASKVQIFLKTSLSFYSLVITLNEGGSMGKIWESEPTPHFFFKQKKRVSCEGCPQLTGRGLPVVLVPPGVVAGEARRPNKGPLLGAVSQT